MEDARRAPAEPASPSLDARHRTPGHGSPQTPRHHHSHDTRTHRHQSAAGHHTSEPRRLLRGGAVLAIVILCLATGLLLALLLRTRRELRTTRDRLSSEVQAERRKAEQSAATANELRAQSAAEAQRREAQLRDLVSGRLPQPLRELLPDTLIELDQAPLRSILFTRVGVAEGTGYEYRYTLICKNEGPTRFQPRLRILLFSETGIQTGSANLRDSLDASRLGTAGMAVGESGSFSGRVTLELADPPKYFTIISLDPDGRLPRLSR